MAKQRDPAHYLTAIALLAYLGADDDGPITVEDDPDEARRRQRETLVGIRDAANSRSPDLGDARSALALVSAAVDLLNAAEVDARDVGSRDVDRRIWKAGRHLAEVVEVLGAAVRLEALEAEVERLRLRAAGAAVPAENVVRIKEAAAALRDEAAALTIDAVKARPEPDAPATLADLPVGTITVYPPLGMVRVRLPDGWDLAVGSDGGVYGTVTPQPGMEPGIYDDVVRVGNGTVPDSWLASHAEVAEIARAWLAERGHSLPAPPAPEPPAPIDADTDDDGYPF